LPTRCDASAFDELAFARIMDKYLHLDLYPDALVSLATMKDFKLRHSPTAAPICSMRW
jgi:2-haloacid dehalogenase